jgi:hypothetical protein
MTVPDDESVNWGLLGGVEVVGWLLIALVVATVVGQGIGFGAGSNSDSE